MNPDETDESVHREPQEAARVKVYRILMGGVVQVVGILSIAVLELVALHNGVDGTLFAPIVGLIGLMVGLSASKVARNFTP